MTAPRSCARCFTYVPKAPRCPQCGSVAFTHTTDLTQFEAALPVVFGGGKRGLEVVGAALSLRSMRPAGKRGEVNGHIRVSDLRYLTR